MRMRPSGQLQHAHDDGHGADAVEVLLAGVLVLEVLLRRQHDDAVLGQRLVHRVDRLLPRHRQRHDDERKDHQVLERQHRQDVGDLDCFFFRGFVRVSHVNLSYRMRGENQSGVALVQWLFPPTLCTLLQSVQLFHKRIDVFESAIHRGESHVGHRDRGRAGDP